MSSDDQKWFVFQDQHQTLLGHGTRSLAARYLAHLNQHRAVNHYLMGSIEEYPGLSVSAAENSSGRIEMEEELRPR